MQQDFVTQSEKLSNALKTLKPDVTREDRKTAEDKFKISNATISRYLSGDVRDNDLAADLILFFRGKIEKRDKALNE
jgi:hypothetical protein